MATGLKNFKIYTLAERLEIYIHKVADTFPKKAISSANQIRRSSSSVVDNIAESYGRFTYKEKRYKIIIARGEAEETKSGAIRAHKKGLIPKEVALLIENEYTELIKMINGYIKFLNNRDGDS